MEILSQHIDDEVGVYRLRNGQKVYYLEISTDIFDDDTMCRPYLLLPKLPPLPDTESTRITLRRTEEGELRFDISEKPLPAVQTVWHTQQIDILSLPRIRRYKMGVYEVSYQGQTAVAKFACFEWQVRNAENETCAYAFMSEYHNQHPDEPSLGPKFLAHLTENGRVMGMLLEKIEGDHASIDSVSACEDVLRRVHGAGILHGDVNRYNFLVDPVSKRARMVDFEHSCEATAASHEAFAVEIESLKEELVEETGRGRPLILAT